MPIVDRWVIYEFDRNSYEQIAKGLKGDVIDMRDQTIMKEDEVDYLSEHGRLMIQSCNQAVLEMIQEMALHDELVVMTDLHGNPIWVKAREVLEKNPGLMLKDVDYTPVEVHVK